MTTQSMRLGKQHLLEVAEGLFTEHGFQAVSIRDIAQAGGVTNAALYYHFSSKEALFDEVIEYHIDKLAQQMQQASTKFTNTRDKLTVILEEYASHVSERRSPLFSLRGKPDKVRPEKHQKQYAHLLGRLLAPLEIALDAGVAKGELRPLPVGYSPASLLLGLFHGMLQHRKQNTDGQITPNDIELVIEIFWNGLNIENIRSNANG